MSKNGVTKRGRPRKHKSDAERQRAYRQRRADTQAEWEKKYTGRRVFVDPNEIMDTIVREAQALLDAGDFFRNRRNWRPDLDRQRIPGWIEELKRARRILNRFMRQLKKL